MMDDQGQLGFQAWWLLSSGVWWPMGEPADSPDVARDALYARLRSKEPSLDVDRRVAVLPAGERPTAPDDDTG